MYTADFVDDYIKTLKEQGIPLSEVAWKTALACVGWAYVFGARGQYCTPANRRSRYNGTSAGKDHDNIKDKCKNFDGNKSCSGCQWYPGGRTRFFDCRGFTYWILLQVYGWKLNGSGCTSQWNDNSNWKAKGKIADGIPENTLVCLFYQNKSNPKTIEHTGFGYNGATVECSGTVYKKSTMDKKWTLWAIPKCIEGDIPPMSKPTLRKGDKGEYVTLLQTKLIQLGYDLSPYGADGKFGNKTLDAVKAFQRDNKLDPDGICGRLTWAALDSGEMTYYTVTVSHVSKTVAESIVSKYGGTVTAEE